MNPPLTLPCADPPAVAHFEVSDPNGTYYEAFSPPLASVDLKIGETTVERLTTTYAAELEHFFAGSTHPYIPASEFHRANQAIAEIIHAQYQLMDFELSPTMPFTWKDVPRTSVYALPDDNSIGPYYCANDGTQSGSQERRELLTWALLPSSRVDVSFYNPEIRQWFCPAPFFTYTFTITPESSTIVVDVDSGTHHLTTSTFDANDPQLLETAFNESRPISEMPDATEIHAIVRSFARALRRNRITSNTRTEIVGNLDN